MASLDWIGETFPPQGALAAEGFGKLLGRPRLDPLTVLVRETAQNSWDARLPRASVYYSIDGFTLDEPQFTVMTRDVFVDLPPSGLALSDSLRKDQLSVLIVSDLHTKGLGGPTRADRPADGPTDYIDLLMNVGVASSNEYGGGTYGFGKTIAYVVSRGKTIIVHTRTANGIARPETRLIASGIGDQFTYKRNRYTGRHWWGRDRDGSPEPQIGRAAEKLARSIGFPGFDDNETGTSIMIVDPDLGDLPPVDAMRFLADAITWNLWPKMVKRNGRQPMHFSVSWDGALVPVRPPSELIPLQGFVPALEALREHDSPFRRDDGLELLEISSQRPRRRLGRLVLNTFVAKARPLVPREAADDEEEEPPTASSFTGNSHHVALLRAPELVVSYLSGPELPDSSLEWGGVFICDKDLDGAFAASEPPTHDDWQPMLVAEKRDKRVVNLALRGVRDTIRKRTLLGPDVAQPGASSAARIADGLAGLVAGLAGSGPGRETRGATRGPQPRRPTVGEAKCAPVLNDGARYTVLTFTLMNPTKHPVQLVIRTGVATNDGSGIESDPPAGSPSPVLVYVDGPTSIEAEGSNEVEVTTDVDGTSNWTVLATSPDEVMVAFDVDVNEVPAQRPT